MAHQTKAHKRRRETAADRRAINAHTNAMLSLGCLACAQLGELTNASVHHIRQGLGMSQRSSDLRTLGLCYGHHQAHGKYDISIHHSPIAFKIKFGDELSLLHQMLHQLYPEYSFPESYTPEVVEELTGYMGAA